MTRVVGAAGRRLSDSGRLALWTGRLVATGAVTGCAASGAGGTSAAGCVGSTSGTTGAATGSVVGVGAVVGMVGVVGGTTLGGGAASELPDVLRTSASEAMSLFDIGFELGPTRQNGRARAAPFPASRGQPKGREVPIISSPTDGNPAQ